MRPRSLPDLGGRCRPGTAACNALEKYMEGSGLALSDLSWPSSERIDMVVGLTDARLVTGCIEVSERIPGLPSSLSLLTNPLTDKPLIVGTINLTDDDKSRKENLNFFSVIENMGPISEDLSYLYKDKEINQVSKCEEPSEDMICSDEEPNSEDELLIGKNMMKQTSTFLILSEDYLKFSRLQKSRSIKNSKSQLLTLLW